MRKTLAGWLIMAVILGGAAEIERAETAVVPRVRVATAAPEELPDAQHLHALLIGIDHYRDRAWRTLDCPVADCTQIATLLQDSYGYRSANIRPLYNENATRKEIVDTIAGYTRQKLGEEDSLFIYYSGHGTEDGAWVPYDAEVGSPSSYVTKDDLAPYLTNAKLSTKHLVVVSDSCYSAKWLPLDRGIPRVEPLDRPAAVQRFASPSRYVIASALEKAHEGQAHSPFALQLIRCLDKREVSEVIPVEALGKAIADGTGTRASHGPLEGYDPGRPEELKVQKVGGFAFFRRAPSESKTVDGEMRPEEAQRILAGVDRALVSAAALEDPELLGGYAIEEIGKKALAEAAAQLALARSELTAAVGIHVKPPLPRAAVDERQQRIDRLGYLRGEGIQKGIEGVIEKYREAREEQEAAGKAPEAAATGLLRLSKLKDLPAPVTRRLQAALYCIPLRYYAQDIEKKPEPKQQENREFLRYWAKQAVTTLDAPLDELYAVNESLADLREAEKALLRERLVPALLPSTLKADSEPLGDSPDPWRRVFPPVVRNTKDMEFVFVPPGRFTLGTEALAGYDHCKPPHEVTITQPFYLGKYEASVGDYRKMDPQACPGEGKEGPMVGLSYPQILAYLKWLSRSEMLAETAVDEGRGELAKDWRWLKDREGYRLPTEAEWEYACCGAPAVVDSPGTAWFDKPGVCLRTSVKTEEVEPNGLGLYFMLGNVNEFTADWYAPYTEAAKTDPLTAYDPELTFSGEKKALLIARGGHYGTKLDETEASPHFRRTRDPGVGTPRHLGFRIALPVFVVDNPNEVRLVQAPAPGPTAPTTTK